MPEFSFASALTVHAADAQKALQLAREARDFLNEPHLFGCFVYQPGGEEQPAELTLTSSTPTDDPHRT